MTAWRELRRDRRMLSSQKTTWRSWITWRILSASSALPTPLPHVSIAFTVNASAPARCTAFVQIHGQKWYSTSSVSIFFSLTRLNHVALCNEIQEESNSAANRFKNLQLLVNFILYTIYILLTMLDLPFIKFVGKFQPVIFSLYRRHDKQN